MYRSRSNYSNQMYRGKKKISLGELGVMIALGIILMSIPFLTLSYAENNDDWLARLWTPKEYVDPQVEYIRDLKDEIFGLEVARDELSENQTRVLNSLEEYKDKNQQILAQQNARTVLDFSRIPNRPRYIIEVMFREWKRLGGTYDFVPYAICGYESHFNPLTRNTDGENSWGLFQVNVGHPAHAARMEWRDYARLYEPVFNMQYQFPELIEFEKRGIAKGLTGADLVKYVARHGQRPVYSEYVRNTIDQYYAEFMMAKIN